MVIQKALQDIDSAFVLEHALPQWPERGLPLFEGSKLT